MKIIIVSQYYWPENFRINSLAELLNEAGNSVTVLTGLPNYPQGYIYKEYKSGNKRTESHNGVNIIRARLVERRNNVFYRFLNYYSFPFYANKLIKTITDEFDVVLINGLSPIMSAFPGIKYAKMHNKKVLMYEMDLWPESLLAGGIKKDSLIYNHYKKISSNIYSKCDKILVSTKEHIDYIKKLPGCSNLNIEYLPQYAEPIFETAITEQKRNTRKLNLMFAGNIGKAQSIATIIKTAKILGNDNYLFHIVGDGSELKNAKLMAETLKCKNVIFYGPKKLSDMPKFYEIADIMLLTLENKSYANMTLPGKVQSYMACGKPIFAAANGAVANLINESGCGIVVASEDSAALAIAIKNVSREDLEKYSKNSFTYYKANFAKEMFINTLIKNLEELLY